jgi:hypothetical protein
MDLDERKPALHWLLLLAVAESSCAVLCCKEACRVKEMCCSLEHAPVSPRSSCQALSLQPKVQETYRYTGGQVADIRQN